MEHTYYVPGMVLGVGLTWGIPCLVGIKGIFEKHLGRKRSFPWPLWFMTTNSKLLVANGKSIFFFLFLFLQGEVYLKAMAAAFSISFN